jgi:hypothetical protein
MLTRSDRTSVSVPTGVSVDVVGVGLRSGIVLTPDAPRGSERTASVPTMPSVSVRRGVPIGPESVAFVVPAPDASEGPESIASVREIASADAPALGSAIDPGTAGTR